jgi:IS5 family transposase
MLWSLGCDDRSIQRATARFLSASTPEYDNKTLAFGIRISGEKGRDCGLPKDIFDQVATKDAASPLADDFERFRASKTQSAARAGMKAHVGVDSKTKLIHCALVTSAHVADATVLPELLHGEDTRLWGIRRIVGRRMSSTNVEVRYRGLAKNANRLFAKLRPRPD